MTAFLNDGFLRRAWSFMAELLGNEIIHAAEVQANNRGKSMGPARIDVIARPAFSRRTDSVAIRMPATGHYVYSAHSLDLKVKIALSRRFWGIAGPPELPGPEGEELVSPGSLWVDVEIDSDFLGAFLDFLVGWKDDMRAMIRDNIADQLGFFGSTLHEESLVPPIPAPTLMAGNPELGPNEAVDIVLVADGYDDPAQFRAVADRFLEIVHAPVTTGMNEPWNSFATAIRVWTIEPPVGNARSPGHRVVAATRDANAGKQRAGFANLARLDAIGLAAQQVNADVIVMVSHEESLNAGSIAAMTMGPLVLLPASELDPSGAASVLIHELAHTQLGGLGDEYLERSGSYKGDEPGVPNVTIFPPRPVSPDPSRPHAPPKWARWVTDGIALPTWDTQPIGGHEGARYFPNGLWRPADRCKMREASADLAFCAVCREALTRGFRTIFRRDAFVVDVPAPGGGSSRRLRLAPNDGAHRIVHRVRVAEQGASRVDLQLVAATLPRPWRITAPPHVVVGPSSASFDASFGDIVTLQLSSDCPFTPWDPLPSYALELRCDLPLGAAPSAPSTPANLEVSIEPDLPGGRLLTVFSADTVDADLDDMRIRFAVFDRDDRQIASVETQWIVWASATEPARGSVVVRLSSGDYHVRARAVDASGATSGWSDMVPFTVPRGGGGRPGPIFEP